MNSIGTVGNPRIKSSRNRTRASREREKEEEENLTRAIRAPTGSFSSTLDAGLGKAEVAAQGAPARGARPAPALPEPQRRRSSRSGSH